MYGTRTLFVTFLNLAYTMLYKTLSTVNKIQPPSRSNAYILYSDCVRMQSEA